MSQVRNPGGKVLVWEMRAAFDGLVCFCGGPDGYDLLADWHSGKANLGFADGHVELRRPAEVADRAEFYFLTGNPEDCGTHTSW
jgi:prepilin-type processing-associated H-X9-DG protein